MDGNDLPSWQCFIDGVQSISTSGNDRPSNAVQLCRSHAWITDATHEVTVSVVTDGPIFYFDYVFFIPSPTMLLENTVVKVANVDSSLNFSGHGWIMPGDPHDTWPLTSVDGDQIIFSFFGECRCPCPNCNSSHDQANMSRLYLTHLPQSTGTRRSENTPLTTLRPRGSLFLVTNGSRLSTISSSSRHQKSRMVLTSSSSLTREQTIRPLYCSIGSSSQLELYLPLRVHRLPFQVHRLPLRAPSRCHQFQRQLAQPRRYQHHRLPSM